MQGRIEPPKAARGHVTCIEGEVLRVTKLEFKFSRDRFMRMRISKCTATFLPGMAIIPSTAFVFNQDLAS